VSNSQTSLTFRFEERLLLLRETLLGAHSVLIYSETCLFQERISATLTAAAANRCEIDRKISKSTTVMILLLFCATQAPRSLLLLLFVTFVCVITQSKVTAKATVIIIFVLSLGVETRLPGVKDFVRRRRWRF
jgi:hypothetical protein